MIRARALLFATCVAWAAFAPVASADIPPGPPPTPTAQAGETPDDRATGFEAVEGASTENVSGLGLMVVAYGLVWAFTMLYFVRISRLEATLAADVARLEKVLGPE